MKFLKSIGRRWMTRCPYAWPVEVSTTFSSKKSFVSGLGNESLNATRIDLTPHVYLGKPPTSSKAKEVKPRLIPDFIDVYAGVSEPEEHEIGSTGGAQVIVRAYKKKAPQPQTISLSQWIGARVKILNTLLVQHSMEMWAIQDYLAYMISELIEDHTWQSVILYDNEYRKLQHRHQFRWGSDSQHLHTRFLKKRQATPHPPSKAW